MGAVQLSEPKLDPAQEAEMQALLKQFKHVVCEKLGNTSPVTHRGGSDIQKVVRPGSGCGYPVMCATSC